MREADLLSIYVRDRLNAAFTALVERHLNLVYSVARRHVRDAAAAEDVAQAVFAELARSATQIKPGTPLVAWLHLVARHTALNAARSEQRRHDHEAAAAYLETMNPPPPPWTDVEPLLDEAVESLAEPDRTAILLRYFENKSLRDVGEALGTSDDAAQKRVSRAIDELRAFFVRRGVTVSAAGLATELSAHAVHVAPGKLGAVIAAEAATASAGSTPIIAMTTLQKAAVATTLVVAAGLGLYEAASSHAHAAAVTAAEGTLVTLRVQHRALAAEVAASAERLRAIEARVAASRARAGNSDEPALEAQMHELLGRLDRWKRWVSDRPGQNTPELQLLSDADWFAIGADANLSTEVELRQASALLRQLATDQVTPRLRRALAGYLAMSGGVLPGHPRELASLVEPPVDPALLESYEMLQTGRLDEIPEEDRRRIIGPRHVADLRYDRYRAIGPTSYEGSAAMSFNVNHAQRGFARANGGQRATMAAQLVPFLKWPAEETLVQEFITRAAPAPDAKAARP